MSVWRLKRQLSYLSMVIATIIIVGIIVYFVDRPPATCFDGKQNQNEIGVDCGGTCKRICAANVLPLKTVWVRPFEISPGLYSVMALIENPNLTQGVKKLSYTIKLFDQMGQLVKEIKGENEALPQNLFTIFESNISARQGEISRAFIDFDDNNVWQEITDPKILLRVSQKSFDNTSQPKLLATITNEMAEDLKNVRVIVVLSDADGNAFSTSATLVDFLPRLSKRDIFFTWPESFPTNPTFIDFYSQVLGENF